MRFTRDQKEKINFIQGPKTQNQLYSSLETQTSRAFHHLRDSFELQIETQICAVHSKSKPKSSRFHLNSKSKPIWFTPSSRFQILRKSFHPPSSNRNPKFLRLQMTNPISVLKCELLNWFAKMRRFWFSISSGNVNRELKSWMVKLKSLNGMMDEHERMEDERIGVCIVIFFLISECEEWSKERFLVKMMKR